MVTKFKSLIFSPEKPCRFYGLVFLIILFPLFPLLPGFFRIQGFYIDWWNHLWMTNYFGIFYEHNSAFPLVINTNNFGGIGNPSPLFYGYLFYPFFGWISSLLNADMALRLPFFGLWFIQFLALYNVFIQQTANRLITLTITALCLWTIYPLTSIYNRSALTEAYATGLLTVTFCCLLLFLREEEWKRKLRYLSYLGLSMTLVIGFHPITGLYGSCFLALVFLIHLITSSKNSTEILKDFLILFGVGLLSFLIIAPWTYMIFEFGENIKISTDANVTLFPESIDYFISRFMPFPLDLRSLVYGFKVEGGTPFLETQTNVPLGILWIWLAYSLTNINRFFSYPVQHEKKFQFKLYRSPAIFLSILLFGLTTWMSLSTTPYEYLPNFFQNIEFAYRMLFYQNLSIIFAVYSLFHVSQISLFKIEKTKFHKVLPIISTICLSFSFLACLEKNMHGLAIVGFSKPKIPKTLEESLQLNRQNYGTYKYTVNNIPQVKGKNFVNVNFKVDLSQGFGIGVKPIHLNLSETQWIRTNIHAFPWNQLDVNGSPLKKELLKMVAGKADTGKLTMNTNHLAFQLRSQKHNLHYQFKPEPIYMVAREISMWLLLIWIGVTVLLEGVLFFSKYRIFNLQK